MDHELCPGVAGHDLGQNWRISDLALPSLTSLYPDFRSKGLF